MYYTYAYLREDKTPYYIGKGTGNRACVSHKRKNGADFRPKLESQILILKHFGCEKEAYKHEKYLIFLYGLKINNGLLINMTSGGDGGGHIKYSDDERKEAYYKKYKERLERYRERRLELERIRKRENREYYNKKAVEYRKKNKEKYSEYIKEYKEKNRERINELQRKRRNADKEKTNKEQKEYRDRNRDEIRRKDREYYTKNKEKIKARKKNQN
jgi:hypothetical protein